MYLLMGGFLIGAAMKVKKALLIAILLSVVLVFCFTSNFKFTKGRFFKVNSNGHTYGSVSDLHPPSGITRAALSEYYPDLIQVELADGSIGFITKEDYLNLEVSSPEIAINYMNNGGDSSDIEVIDLNENVIGVLGS